MARTEPAMIDLHGATWVSQGEYKLQPSARRYEFYERDFAAMVRRDFAAAHHRRSCADCGSTQRKACRLASAVLHA